MTDEKKFVTIGGGIGSFCFYNALRIHGVSYKDIAVITLHKNPYLQFKLNCESINLEKLRSDSGSRPDNFWGFPGYGFEEAIICLQKWQVFKAFKLFFQLFFEPLLFNYYSPSVKQVYKPLDREMKRTNWSKSLHLGKAISLNRLDEKYEVTFVDKKNTRHKIVTHNVHIALGHGSSYKNYEPLLKKIKQKGGRVLVIGRGTAAARMVERLLTLKSKKKVEVLSLHRNELPDYGDSRGIKQKRFLSWRLQQFNWPRSAFGGELKEEIEQSGSLKYLYEWGSPSVVADKQRIRLLNYNFKKGRYKITLGDKNVNTDYVIDCSGFKENSKQNKFLDNLIKKYGLPLNKLGNIKTGKNFEIEKLCTYQGRVSISGISASGNYYGPVDSFLGHQYAALSIIKNTPEIKSLTAVDSLIEWYKWMRNKKI